MKTILFILFQTIFIIAQAQIEVSGFVIDEKKKPVIGANIFLQGTYDGCTSDSSGYFYFKTSEKGAQILIASFVGFQTKGYPIEINSSNISGIEIILNKELTEIDEVVINAGTFEASGKKKSVALKPLDIALTASANGDIFGAFGTLPGSHMVGEEGRLFVRGGESYETKMFMDGMLVQTPYFSKTPELPTRGRFSPLLFNNMVFSTGGYSAEFGQALSSIVALKTNALEPETKSSISVLSVGVQGSHAKRWKASSLALTGELLHTGLSNKLFKQNIDWIKEPVIAGSTIMFRQKTSETGMIKTFGSFSYNASSMMYNNIQKSTIQNISLSNYNTYLNTTYNEIFHEKWMINTGVAVNFDQEKTRLPEQEIFTSKKNYQVKVNLTNFTSNKITTKIGADQIYYNYSQDILMEDDFLFNFSNNQFSSFVESEIKTGSIFAFKLGIRAEHTSILRNTTLMPRISAALKTGKNSQISMAFGQFRQNPEDDYLKFSTELNPEKAIHSILTYQYKKDTKTLRIEVYNKKYSNLIKFTDEYSFVTGNYNNDGFGYSQGVDFFWRNKKAFGKSDYWISYSWNDSKRNYRDYPVEANPHYFSAHNLSVVYKKFFTKINCFGSASYSFASGRPYYNPNNSVFMADKTKPYNDISLGITHIMYLFNTQTVLHLNVTNIFAFNNIYGYTFNEIPNASGQYDLKPLVPPSKRMAVLLISFLL